MFVSRKCLKLNLFHELVDYNRNRIGKILKPNRVAGKLVKEFREIESIEIFLNVFALCVEIIFLEQKEILYKYGDRFISYDFHILPKKCILQVNSYSKLS